MICWLRSARRSLAAKAGVPAEAGANRSRGPKEKGRSGVRPRMAFVLWISSRRLVLRSLGGAGSLGEGGSHRGSAGAPRVLVVYPESTPRRGRYKWIPLRGRRSLRIWTIFARVLPAADVLRLGKWPGGRDGCGKRRNVALKSAPKDLCALSRDNMPERADDSIPTRPNRLMRLGRRNTVAQPLRAEIINGKGPWWSWGTVE
jgi:hypothetical protein